MTPLAMLILAIAAPLGVGFLTLLLPRQAIGLRVGFALAGPLVSVGALGWFAASHGIGAEVAPVAWMPGLHLDLALRADGLGCFFAMLVAAIGAMIVLYARAYFGPDRDALYRFYPSLNLFMTAMLGIVLSDSFLLMLMFWELTSISSFLLIGWERFDKSAVAKAMQAFMVTGAGGIALMAGLVLLGVITGQWTYSGVAALAAAGQLAPEMPLIAAFVLIFIGAAAKSAQWPLHFWLPGAMAAPTPVSAYLHSATMVKAGVYLLGRLWPIFASPLLPGPLALWPGLLMTIGGLTMAWGAWIALQKYDLKQIFAYTTVSQLGLLVCMYGLGGLTYAHGDHVEPNLIWDVTQILNHALYKAPLFMLAGAVGHVASRELPALRGLVRRGRTEMILAILLVLAGYALAAGPGTLSFAAKEMFLYQIVHSASSLPPWGVG